MESKRSRSRNYSFRVILYGRGFYCSFPLCFALSTIADISFDTHLEVFPIFFVNAPVFPVLLYVLSHYQHKSDLLIFSDVLLSHLRPILNPITKSFALSKELRFIVDGDVSGFSFVTSIEASVSA